MKFFLPSILCISSREPASDDVADDRRHDVNAEEDAQEAADKAAAIAVDLATHGRPHELFKHRAGVKREENAADRRGQERIAIWLFSGCTDLVRLGVVGGHDLHRDAN